DDCWKGWAILLRQKQKKLIMLPSETMIWQPEFTDKTLSRKPGAVHTAVSLRLLFLRTAVNDFMDSVHHIWCPLFSQEFQDLPDGAETTLTSNSSDSDQTVQAVRLRMSGIYGRKKPTLLPALVMAVK
ncbi:hypothetical protein, partial [Escherichia coli]|uniref:hypothetical protein n=3 Tax=Escherichia coli TaxID=562 RepID=UPI001BDB9DE1